MRNRPEADGIAVSAQYSTEGGATSVRASGSMKPAVMQTMGFSSLKISAAAAAAIVDGGKACVLSVNKSASGATTAQGNTQLNLKGCSLYDNSSSGTALNVSGSAKISAL